MELEETLISTAVNLGTLDGSKINRTRWKHEKSLQNLGVRKTFVTMNQKSRSHKRKNGELYKYL